MYIQYSKLQSTVIWNIGQLTILYLWRNNNTLLYSRNLLKLLLASDQFNLYFVTCIQGVKSALCWKVYLLDKLINKLQNYKASKWGGLRHRQTGFLEFLLNPDPWISSLVKWFVLSNTMVSCIWNKLSPFLLVMNNFLTGSFVCALSVIILQFLH